jgi:exodeoxyribonuclease VII small subunit
MPPKKTKIDDFEKALARLEEITEKLESGEVKLEDSMALYSEGAELAALCNKKLNEAEKKIKVIKEQNQNLIEIDFEEDE